MKCRCFLTLNCFLRKCVRTVLFYFLIFAIKPYHIFCAVHVKVGFLLIDSLYSERDLNMTFYETKSTISDLDSLQLDYVISNMNSSVEVGEIYSIFADSTINIVVAKAPFKYVSTLGLFASEYNKPLILADSYLPYKQSHQSVSLYNGFELTSAAVLEYLEWFQWANAAVISADDTYWQQMVPTLESRMFQQQFNVKHSRTISDLSSPSDILDILTDISLVEKGMVQSLNCMFTLSWSMESIINAHSW